jgi:hypothetical protein
MTVIITSSHPTSVTIASSIAPRLKHYAGRIHALGPGPLYNLLCELSTSSATMARFEAYADLDRDFIRKFDGDRLPPVRLRLVK